MKNNPFTSLSSARLSTVLAIALCAFYVITINSQIAFSSMKYEEGVSKRTQVRALNLPDSPILIKGKIVSIAGEQEILVFRYSIANLTTDYIQSCQIALYIFDKKSRMKSGQIWRAPVELKANTTEVFSVPLKHKPAKDDRVIVVINKVTINGITLDFDNSSLMVTLQSTAPGLSDRVRPVVFQGGGTCPAEFCTNQRVGATESCGQNGSCGLKSFSCNQLSCTVDFTCHPCGGPPPEGGDN
jgi:hypothetical protein